jgi:hypothetical protein
MNSWMIAAGLAASAVLRPNGVVRPSCPLRALACEGEDGTFMFVQNSHRFAQHVSAFVRR